jgi:hypothetical protein
LKDFPEVELEKVGFISNRARVREAGVKTIPALVSGDRTLTSMFMTKKKIREFVESL